MRKPVTEYQKLLQKKYGKEYQGKDEGEEFYTYMFLAPGQYGVEEDVIEFINSHPDATIEELLAFVDTVIPDIEVVDEDVEDED
ncbi:MAG: hypothetical protein IKU47_04065 [Oscillospiraceae bacterium]|nr:hypothetical protein [Oscillospiraceae bacterium]